MGTRELVERVSAGDRAAWAELYNEYKRVVMGVCVAILKDQDEALDAAQETFMKVFEKAESLNPNGNLKGWLTTIAANHCRDRLRKRKSGLQWFKQWVASNSDTLEKPSVEKAVVMEFQNETMELAIAELEDEFRIPLVLKFYSDLSYKEIAEIMSEREGKKIAEETIGSRLNRAKSKLKAILIERGVYPHART